MVKKALSNSHGKLRVSFDYWAGNILIKGDLIGNDALNKLSKLHNDIGNYAKHPNKVTQLKIMLNYFNTSSLSILFKIMQTLEKLHLKSNSEVNVLWYAKEDDVDLIEAVTGYKDICPNLNITIQFVK